MTSTSMSLLDPRAPAGPRGTAHTGRSSFLALPSLIHFPVLNPTGIPPADPDFRDFEPLREPVLLRRGNDVGVSSWMTELLQGLGCQETQKGRSARRIFAADGPAFLHQERTLLPEVVPDEGRQSGRYVHDIRPRRPATTHGDH